MAPHHHDNLPAILLDGGVFFTRDPVARRGGGSLPAGIPLGLFPPTYQPMTIVTAKPPKRQPRPPRPRPRLVRRSSRRGTAGQG
jgi:hypothetical protein